MSRRDPLVMADIRPNQWDQPAMYSEFRWTDASLHRNRQTRSREPLQPHLLIAFAEHLGSEVFVDIGANIGVYSLFMSTVPSVKEIHAFEPSPGTFQALCKNIRINELTELVGAHCKAVSDTQTSMAFGIVKRLAGANSVLATTIHKKSKFTSTIQVEGVRLDEYLPIAGRRLCLKIDVEGHEPAAIAGMQRLLADNQVILQIEDYSESDKLDRALSSLGLRSVFRVAADRYFTNVPDLKSCDILTILEHASRQMVRTSLKPHHGTTDGVSPVTIRFGRHLKVQVGGVLARIARSLRSRVRRKG